MPIRRHVTRSEHRTNGRPPLLLACCLLATTLACGQATPRRPAQIQRTDSAGVEIVTVPGEMLDHLPLRSFAPEPVLSIAGDQLEGFPLSQISGGVILPNHAVAIADRVLDRVAVVGFSGTLLHRFGRRGDGPGELHDASGLRRRAGDELVVWDGSAARLLVYDTAGSFRDLIQMPVARTAQRMLPFPGFLADGSTVFERRRLQPPGPFDGVRRPDFVVDRYRPDGAFAGALASIPGKKALGVVHGRSWLALEFDPAGPHVAVGAGRAFLGTGERFQVQTWSAAGLERIVRIVRARRVTSDSDREAWRDTLLARMARMPFQAHVRRSNIPPIDSFPAFEDLRADAEGDVWVEEDRGLRQDGRTSWVILDRTGEPLARIDVPEGFDILDIRGDLVLGVSKDELDVPRVLLYRIEAPA